MIVTNSMIPYSFVPGTKAKASEVNANFVAISDYIDNTNTQIVDNMNSSLALKADKTELITEHTVNSTGTDLNNYKTKGTYIFTLGYLPVNRPQNIEETVVDEDLEMNWTRPDNCGVKDGVLIVTGDTNSVIRQIWICTGSNPEIFTREYKNSSWGNWYSTVGDASVGASGYIKLPNGIIIQWGIMTGKVITYPVAFRGLACPIVTKQGASSSVTRADGGLTNQSKTGFTYTTYGSFTYMNWFAVGF